MDMGIWPCFHVDLLQQASSNPLPGQYTEDPQPVLLLNDNGNAEWEVQEVLYAYSKRVGCSSQCKALVRWRGYAKPTWEPLDSLQDIEALDQFKIAYRDA